MRRTKIVATLGPASDSSEMIEALIEAGVNVFRLNFSHGSHDEHARRIARIRAASARLDRAIGLLQDLQGPKIRTGTFTEVDSVKLVEGATFTITNRPVPGDKTIVSTIYEALPRDVKPGDRILLSDGLLELRVESTTETDVVCTVIQGGELRERQGINLPGVNVSAPSLTEKDIEDLEFGLAQDVDFIALSFVRRAADVKALRERITAAGKDIQIIAKIEKPEAVQNLEEILDVVDGVMVARGDLGVEMPLEQVPLIQKRIIEQANRRSLPVITATQMLESMISNPRPTRAEASDVANAILDGTHAVMLSGETARGDFPVETVRTMARIAETAEEEGAQYVRLQRAGWQFSEADTELRSVGAAVAAMVEAMRTDAVWVFTESGNTARMIAYFRPRVPIIALTPSEKMYRRLSLVWGVLPIFVGSSEYENFAHVFPLLEARGLVNRGDRVVVTGGHPFGQGLATNFIKVITATPGHPTATL